MPVLITASALLLLFRPGKSGRASFLDPTALRARVASELPDGEVRTRALALVDEFVELARAYVATTESALDAYAAHTTTGDFTAASCIESVRPAERSRADTLHRIVHIRRELLEVLSREQWSALFD